MSNSTGVNDRTKRFARSVPPGVVLAEAIAAKGWTQKTLAFVLGRPIPMISEVITGKKSITAETAHQLEAAGLMPAHRWVALQALWELRQKPKGLASIRRRARTA